MDPFIYRECRATITARIPDTPDADAHPDRVLVQGRGTAHPQFQGGSVVFPEIGEYAIPQPIPVVIQDGELLVEVLAGDESVETQPLFLPVTVDERANQNWSWRLTFDLLTLGEYGEEVTHPPLSFPVEAGDGPLEISTVATPVIKSQGFVTRGAPGPGLQEITAEDGEIVFSWDNGRSTAIDVPGAVPGPRGHQGVKGDKGDPGDVRFEGIDPGITVRADDVLIGDTTVPSTGTAIAASADAEFLARSHSNLRTAAATVDTTVGTRVFLGGVMVHGDTGWCDVTHQITNWDVERAEIRRQNDTITVRFMTLTRGSGSDGLFLDGLPAGWARDDRSTLVPIALNITGTTSVALLFSSSIHLPTATPDTQAGYWVSFSYPAPRMWPTELMGDPTPAPAWAGATTAEFSGTRSLYNESAAGEVRSLIRAGLAGERVRLVCTGPSTVTGTGAVHPRVAVSSWPAQLGVLLGAQPGRVVASQYDNRWVFSGGIAGRTSMWALGAQATDDFTATYTSNEPTTGYTLYAYRQAGGALTIQVDDRPAVEVPVPSGGGWKALRIDGLPYTRHVVTISGPSGVYLDSIEADATGLTIHNNGRPSSSADNWRLPDNPSTSWSQLYASAYGQLDLNAAVPAPDLVMMQPLLNGSTPAQITRAVADAALLDVPTVLVTCGGVGGMIPDSTVPDQIEALYSAADTHDMPLIDLTHSMGWYAEASAAGLMADTVHPNRSGYGLQAATIYRALTT